MKKIFRISTYLLPLYLTLLLAFSSCQHEAEVPPIIPGINDSICFVTQVLPLIQSNCAKSGCHDGSGEFPLNDYSSIVSKVEPGKPNKSELYKVMNATPGSESFMPPSPNQALTNEQITIVQLWILEGALPTQCNTVTCDSVNVSFTGTIQPILENNCLGCHSGANPSASLNLGTYEQVKLAVQSKHLFDHLYGSNGYSMMPPLTQLPSCNLAQFRKWISDGMLP